MQQLVHQVRDWFSGVCDQNGPPARRDEGAYLNGYMTEEQRSRRPIFIATLRAARLSAGCFVAHRSKTTAGILPLRFAHPAEIRGGAATPATDLVHWACCALVDLASLDGPGEIQPSAFQRRLRKCSRQSG